jgi:hypothetical protein
MLFWHLDKHASSHVQQHSLASDHLNYRHVPLLLAGFPWMILSDLVAVDTNIIFTQGTAASLKHPGALMQVLRHHHQLLLRAFQFSTTATMSLQ